MSAVSNLDEFAERRIPPATMLFRLVDFVCPRCGDERTGAHVDGDDGTSYVECDVCRNEFDPSVLRIPTQAVLEIWRDDAVLHGNTALRCADGIHGCSYLALASCRRLAPEMTVFGKTRLLTELIDSVGGELTPAQRSIAVELGVALGLPAAAINATVALG
jgi:transcription elongation factor Elf1